MSASIICYTDIYINNKHYNSNFFFFSKNELTVHPTLLSLKEVLWENHPFTIVLKTQSLCGIEFRRELQRSHISFYSFNPLALMSLDLCNYLMAISCLLCFLTKVIPNRVNPRTSFPRICLVVGGKTLLF